MANAQDSTAAPAAGTAEEPDERERREAAEAANREAAATLVKAFGGVRGMIDATLPGLVFVLVFTITKDVGTSSWSAFGLAAAFAVVRLLRRETLQHALSGVFGVAIGAFIATRSGRAENFYLPGLIWNVAYTGAFVVSALVRWPMVGVLLGPILGENLTWKKKNPGRYRAYLKATWVWAGLTAIKPAVLFPVYFAHDATLLGWLKVALGIPPYLLALYITWRILATAPPPIKVVYDDEEGEDGEDGEDGEARTGDAAAEDGEAAPAAAPSAPAPSTPAPSTAAPSAGPVPGAAKETDGAAPR
ncbi:hypothetical protein GCM10027168_38940 [Streptomyces capparidis]